jgi:predicted permease
MRSLYRDFRYGLRVLLASPGYTAVAVLTLAIGIAANTTVFGWIDALLLHPFPGVRDGGQLATLETVTPSGEFNTTSYRDYRDYRDSLKLVSGLGASLLNAFDAGTDENPRRIWGEFVSGNYFDVLGVKPVRGRFFLPEEYGDKPGAYPVAVISHHLWQDLFASDPGVIGKIIRVNRYELTIIGVAPPEFRGVVPGLSLEMWVPMVMAPQLNGQGDWLLSDRGQRQVWITARLKPGVSLGQARAEALACSQRIARENPRDSEGFRASLFPVWQGHFGAQAILLAPLQILMAVGFVLFLIVSANVTNLQLARATTRQKEFSIRLALGAGPGRLARQLLTESLLLAGMGALVGIPLALWAGESLTWLFPSTNLPIGIGLRLNGDILGFTILLCIFTAVVTGLVPALHSLHANVSETLKESGRSATSGAGLHRTRSLLVICELALAFVALTGTGLLARSFQNARAIHPGMDTRNVLFAKYYLATFCRTAEQRTQFCVRLHDRIQSLPGIAGVSYADNVPLDFGQSQRSEIQVEGYAPARGEDMRVSLATVAPGFLDVLRIPLIAGRDFTEQDDRDTAPVMIVSQAFARRFFPGMSVLGRRIYVYGRWFTVVGLAKDSKYHNLTEQPTPHFYMPYRQTHGAEFWVAFFIRTVGPPQGAAAGIRREAAGVDPGAGATDIVPFEEIIAGAVYAQKVAATLLTVIGAISLLLAAVGLYSVMAYAVSQRTNEIGIRLALGAQPRDVLAMVVRQGMILTAAGLTVGLAAALAATRLVSGLLVNVSATDPLVMVLAALFLGLTALLASYLPALRATKVDPITALRCQ